ncbi:MAG: hypothetical protein A2Z21_05605 [Candidatus Fraserbacteria bacterium RBG_16_55_9]|uniref:ABC transporter n=1 Tax=Fraserbacteria sp. (strain RBG_16_55_9) TaxID=1817864 RepID=A0A1F5UPK3_FRAXR|nr:MAG: hypothetical protein A2Z21_05605 [Candidatus Fraserbacteria bacterium RBG_16_55_9]
MEIFQFGFMQRAFLAGLIMAVVAPVIGIFLVLRRLALFGDGLGHIAFGGVALGLFARVNPIVSALLLSVLGAIGIERLRSRGKLAGDAAIAIFFSSGLAMGLILAKLAGGYNSNLLGFLFGSLVSVTPTDLWLTAGLGGAVLLTVLLLRRELFAVTFDEETAKAAGLPVAALNLLLAVLAAVTIVMAMRVVGLLLISALIVLPVAASLQLAKSFRGAFLISIGFGLLSVIAGLFEAYYLDLPAGATVVLTATLIFALAASAAVFQKEPATHGGR